jgi:hypothetical protein
MGEQFRVLDSLQSYYFRVGAPKGLMVSLSNDSVADGDDRAHGRVRLHGRRGRSQSKREGSSKEMLI